MKTKTCSKCKTEKDLSLFNKRCDGSSGVRSACKECSYKNQRSRLLKLKKDKPKKVLEIETGKTCTKCNIYKEFCEYYKHKKCKYGLSSQCKLCINQYAIENKDTIKEKKKEYYKNNSKAIYKRNRAWVEQNKDKIKNYLSEYKDKNKNTLQERAKEYRKENKEKIKQVLKEYYNNNKSELLAKQKEYNKTRKEYNKLKSYEWRKNNREKWIETRTKRNRERYNNDINYRLRSNITSRLNLALQYNRKSAKTTALLRCTIQELKNYLENKFKQGMSWENRSEWHIDHIIPCASFDLSNEEEQKKCFHYTNLQPLWAIENILKRDKI